MSIKKVFLYAEIQVVRRHSKIDWPAINESMKKEKGLKSKTWLSGVNTNTIGGFYEFNSLENAKAYAVGYLAKAAEQLGGSLTVRLFDGDVVAGASRGISSPFYAAGRVCRQGPRRGVSLIFRARRWRAKTVPRNRNLRLIPCAASTVSASRRAGFAPEFRRLVLAERLVEGIAGAAHGADRILFAGVRQGLAQPPDMHVDRALVDFRRKPPDAVEQLRAREHAAGLLHQMFEQAKFGRPQMHVARAAMNAPVLPVEFEIARDKQPATRSGRARRRSARTRAISSGTEKGFTT